MRTAAGTFGKPGMVIMAPVSGTMKLAPADNLTSLIVIVNPVGAPNTFGLSVMDCGVLAIQIGVLSKPRASKSLICCLASSV